MANQPRPPTQGARELARVMAEQNIKQAEAAKRIGVPHATLSRWLRGERSPQAVFLSRIETAFGVRAALWGVAAFDDPLPRTGT